MKPIVFHLEAELEAGVAFYEERRVGLGLAFQDEVESLVRLVRRDPQRWPFYKNTGLRRGHLQRFPYTLYYVELNEVIWIAAIAHQKRRPGYWTDRKPEF